MDARNLKNLGVLSLIVIGIVLMLSGSVNAYSGGGGICNCGNGDTALGGNATDACTDCSAALNDNTHCSNQVNYVGTVQITNYAGGTCINNPTNFTNKTFDCQGNIIDGRGPAYGIYLNNKTGTTIKNCIVTDFIEGIRIDYSSNNTLYNNTAINNHYGIRMSYSSNNVIINNIFNNNYDGIHIIHSSNSILINNTASNNYYGIYLDSSSNSTFTNNTMNNNTYNFNIYGEEILHYYQNIDTSNTVNGKAIFYWTNKANFSNNCTNAIISDLDNPGFVALISCENITVKNLNLHNNSHGILLVNTTNSTLLNNTIKSNNYGFYLYYSLNNRLINNTINLNNYGFYLYSSSNNTLINNTVINNANTGVYFDSYSSNNTFNSNFVCLNKYGINNNGLNSGDNNTCRLGDKWKDINNTGCTYSCPENVCYCSNCTECYEKLNSNCTIVLLTANIINNNGTCIDNPEKFNNKILDCQGFIIKGSGSGLGVYLNKKTGNTIRNCIITDFDKGIHLDSSSNNNIINNTVNLNNYGILLYYSSYNTLTNNTANNNNYGIYLQFSSENTLRNNTMDNNTYNFNIEGSESSYEGPSYSELADYYQDIDDSNLVDGKPIYYWTNKANAPGNCKNATISDLDNAGFVALVSCENITIKNLNLSKNSHGILIVNTTNINIFNNTINSNKQGIYLFYSSNNTINSNSICNNDEADISIRSGTGNTGDNKCNNKIVYMGSSNSVTCTPCPLCYQKTNSICTINIGEDCDCINKALNDPECNEVKLQSDIVDIYGTCIDNPENFSNKILDCQGFMIDGSEKEWWWHYGIYLNNKGGNTIKNCIIANFTYGIYLRSSSNSILINNTVKLNEYHGIWLYSSTHNILINNTASSNTKSGIYIMNSSFNNISNNKLLNNNNTGITISNCDPSGGQCPGGSTNNTIQGNKILNNSIGIYSQSSTTDINSNFVCGNTNLDFNSTDWLSSYGDNNTCDKADGWNDTSTTGCTNTCSYIGEKAKDIFDVVEMLEYLSGEKTQLSHQSEYYKFVGSGEINLFDVFALMDKIVIEG